MGSASISEHLPCSGCDTKSCRFSSEPSHSSQAVDMCWDLVSPPFKRISRHSLHGHSYMSALYSSVVRDNTEFWWTENEFQLIFHCKNKAMKVFWSTCVFYKIKRFFRQQVISHWASPRGNSRLSTLLQFSKQSLQVQVLIACWLQAWEAGTESYTVIRMRKLRLREVKRLGQGPIAQKQQGRALSSGFMMLITWECSVLTLSGIQLLCSWFDLCPCVYLWESSGIWRVSI